MSKKNQRRKAMAAETIAPPPTYAELIAAISRFTAERAPNNADEALAWMAYMRGLAGLLGPPTCEELINYVNRFVHERAEDHPEELITFGMFLAGLVESAGPLLEKFRALAKAQPTPPADPAVN